MTTTQNIIMSRSSNLITTGKITNDEFKSSLEGFTPDTLEVEILKIKDVITEEKRNEGVVIVDENMFLIDSVDRFFTTN